MHRTDHFTIFSPSNSSDANDKHTLGLITRKPQRKTSFTRKKNQEFIEAAIMKGPSSNRYSKENPPMSTQTLTHQKSLQILKPELGQQIKYLSPKNQRVSKVNSCKSNIHSQKSPKFIRKNVKSFIEPTVSPQISQQSMDYDAFSPIISKISLESVINSNQAVESTTHSRYQWLSIENQNENLKKQNHYLIEQLQFVKDQLQNITFKLEKYQLHQNQPVVTRCRNCQKIEDRQKKTVKQKNEMQIKVRSIEQELKNYKLKVFNFEGSIQKYEENLSQLHRQLEKTTDQYIKSEKMQIQLTRIISDLKAQIESDAMQMRYLGIQQTVLLRKKHQCEQTRAEANKLSRERESLKRMVGEYKEKIETLSKVFAKKKQTKKAKTQKDIYNEDLFDLSSEYSIDGF